MIRITLLALVGALFAALVPAAAQDAPQRSITHIAGDLYRFQNQFHFNVFLVTPEGIIATDPINADAARWLKSELDTRFGVPVKYLVYSHDHPDHIAGGEVFADTATVIAHANARVHIVGEQRPTAVPDVTFSDRMTLRLGGKTVELISVGLGHGDNMIVMRFPAERALFAVDIVSVDRMPYRDFSNVYVDQLITGLRQVEAMDYDILVPGHGSVGVPADVAAHRAYIEDLRGQVLGHMRAGKTLDDIRALVDLSAYASWGQFEAWSPLNIDGMYRHLTLYPRSN